MNSKEEVLKVLDALKKEEGFTPVDAIFEGAVGVKEDTTLEFFQKLEDEGMLSGVIRIIYTVGKGKIRFVEIPVGHQGEANTPQQKQ